MLIIRLLRVGKKHKPHFRLVLIEKGKRPGKYLENLGFYTPGAGDKKLRNIEAEKIKYWISKGAKLTPTVHNILLDVMVIAGKKEKIKISKKKEALKPGEAPKAAATKVESKAEVSKAEAPKTEASAETKPVA